MTADDPQPTGQRSWLFSTTPIVTRQLVVPQGYTLSSGGSLAIMLELRPRPGPLAIWLFVVGASAGFVMLVNATRAHRADAPIPPAAGYRLFNVSAVLVVPLTALAASWIPAQQLAFAVAGLVSSSAYVLTVTVLFHMVGRAR